MGPPPAMGMRGGIGRIIGSGSSICFSEEKQPGLVFPSPPFPLLFLDFFLIKNPGITGLYSPPDPPFSLETI